MWFRTLRLLPVFKNTAFAGLSTLSRNAKRKVYVVGVGMTKVYKSSYLYVFDTQLFDLDSDTRNTKKNKQKKRKQKNTNFIYCRRATT